MITEQKIANPQDESVRTRRLFSAESQSVHRGTDGLFAILLPMQWMVGIISSFTLVSGVWDSMVLDSDRHIQAAILVGGIITIPPVLLAIFYPGRTMTRYAIAIVQVIISGLVVHAADHRTESYFHLCGTLAFLSFYRDPKLLITASALAFFGDLISPVLYPPLSDRDLRGEMWRWLELAGWMVFEDIFLIAWIRSNLKSTQHAIIGTAALEANEERYRAVVEQMTESIALLDPDSLKIIECNNAFSRLLGYENADELIGMSVREFSTSTEQQLNELIREMRKRKVLTGERTYRRKDDEMITVEATESLINYGGRSVICATFKDLSERKKADAEMTRLALVAQKTHNSVIVCDPDGKIQWVNEGFMRVTGYQMSEVIGRHPVNFLCGDDTDRKTLAELFTAVNAQVPFHNELYNYKKDGEGYWASISLTPMHNDDGTLQGFISIEMDITERKRMEAKLRLAYEELEQRVFERTGDLVRANKLMQQEIAERQKAEIEVRNAREFLKKVIDNVPTLIAVRDHEERFTLANTAYAKMLGTTVEEMLGKTPAKFYTESDELSRVLEEDEVIFEQLSEKPIYEEKFTDPLGDTHYLETVKRPLIGDDGEKNILVISNDLTERRSLEGQLRHAQKLESIGQLAAGIAHEINTPTQYVSDNIRFFDEAYTDIRMVLDKYEKLLASAESNEFEPELAEELRKEIKAIDLEYLEEEMPKAISQSREGVSRIAKIVQSMKDFAHPGSAEKTAVDLNKAIDSTITVARNEWKYVADMETKFDENLPAVHCIIGELNQVVLNMIINASHAIKDVVGEGVNGKGKITISTTLAKEDWVEIRIKDSGTGIPAKVQNRVFDPFFTTKEIGKGSGQGLAISHTVVVDKHGGKLTFETEEGKGTTFIIGLPVICQDNVPAQLT